MGVAKVYTAILRCMTSTLATIGLLRLALAGLAQESTPEELAVTVGRDGLAIVREVRSAQLGAGRSSLRILDVAPRLLPETVSMRALNQPELVRLEEQSAWFEVLSVERALENLSGRPVELKRFHESGVEELNGRLLFPPVVGSPTGEMHLPLYLEQFDGQIRLLDDAEIVLDALPSGDWNRMRLDWRLECQRADRYRFELLYATRGLSWSADWQLRVNSEATAGDLSVVVTIDNRSGMALRAARLSVQEEGVLHAIADAATIAREGALQSVIATVRNAALAATPTYVVPRFAVAGAAAGDAATVVRRFDLATDTAGRIGRALPSGQARTIVLDSRNRPWLSPVRAVAATRGDTLPPFFGEPITGLRGSAVRQAGGPDEVWQAFVTNHRAEPAELDIAIPLAEHERLVVPQDSASGRVAGWGLARLHVAGRSTATLTLTVKSP